MTIAYYIAMAGSTALSTPIYQGDTLTMDQACSIAQKNAFNIRLQEAAVEKSRQRLAEALAAMGFSVNLSASLTRYDKEQTVSFGGAPVTIQPISTQSASVAISLPVDISGNRHRTAAATRKSYEAAKNTFQAALNDARLNARTAFIAVLRAKAGVGVYKQALQDANERLKQGQLLLEQVQVAKVDVNRLDAAVAQAKSDLLVAQNTLQLAKNALNVALARPVNTPVEVQDLAELPVAALAAERYDSAAQDFRPEILSAKKQVESLALVRRATESTLNPSLNIGVTQNRNIDPQGLSAQDSQMILSLGLTVPLYDSGATRARVKQARQDEATAQVSLQQLQLNISQEVRNAYASLENAKARLDNANRQQSLAQEVFRLAGVRQNAGEGTYVDVIDAETALTQARNNVVSARYDWLVAYAQLQRAVGNDKLTVSPSVLQGAK